MGYEKKIHNLLTRDIHFFFCNSPHAVTKKSSYCLNETDTNSTLNLNHLHFLRDMRRKNNSHETKYENR